MGGELTKIYYFVLNYSVLLTFCFSEFSWKIG